MPSSEGRVGDSVRSQAHALQAESVWEVAAQRGRLPAPAPLQRGFSIWSVLKNAIGKDLTRITLPATINEPMSALQVHFNRLSLRAPILFPLLQAPLMFSTITPRLSPIFSCKLRSSKTRERSGRSLYLLQPAVQDRSRWPTGCCISPVRHGKVRGEDPSLQRIIEDLEYRHLLDQAQATSNPAERAMLVAAFIASGYSATLVRESKPFNPLLGETFEWQSPDSSCRFLCEQVLGPPHV